MSRSHRSPNNQFVEVKSLAVVSAIRDPGLMAFPRTILGSVWLTNVMFRCIREWKNGPTPSSTHLNGMI
jgi:cellobiose-specific phosphotransferase system component IIC